VSLDGKRHALYLPSFCEVENTCGLTKIRTMAPGDEDRRWGSRETLSEALQDCGLTEVFPTSCSVPRTTLVYGQGIIEQYSVRLYVSMKDGSVAKDG